MPTIDLKIGEVEAILDLLTAIKAKGQWLKKLEKDKSVHATYFPSALDKSIEMFREAIPLHTEPFGDNK